MMPPTNQVIQGDCVEILKTFPENSIDLIITDPPYFLPAQHYQTRKKFRRNFADLGILESFFKNLFYEFERTLKRSGRLYVFCDGQSYPLFYFHLYPFCKTVRPLIWDKITSINGYSWRHQHELIVFAELPNAPLIKTGDGDILRGRAVPVNKRLHPAQKPEEIIIKLIQKSAQRGELILDPFCGSGTILVCAKRLGYDWVGIDISEEYCEIAKSRVEREFSHFLTKG